MTDDNNDLKPIWGVKAIAAKIQKPVRQTQYLIDTGRITTGKVGRQRMTTEGQLRRDFARIMGSESS